ncbi:MAG TPA: acetyltransferase [Pyrinomonadaceae bacterium]|jgi:sugar O-acyltransferase (sialic acid O-acetyltransferase NeuD family)
MKKVVIFGTQDFAELAHYYLTNDSPYDVAAFSLSQEYITGDEFKGLPVAAFENVEEKYPPDDFAFFAPMSPRKMSRLRADIYNQIKAKGYELISYISSKATRFNNEIGDNCFILEDNTLQPFTNIGNNVVMWSGNHIGHHGTIKDHAFFTSHVVLSGHCAIEPYCFFGVNSTIRDGLRLAEGTLVGMSASITRNTEEWGVYLGNPAKKLENKLSHEAM